MGEPCKQEGAICGLQATVESIKDTLERLSVGQEKFILVLERIAQQNEAITTLQKQQDEIFERVRDVEVKAAAERVKTSTLVAAISLVVSTTTAAIARQLWR